MGNEAEGGFCMTADDVDISPEAADSLDLEGVVELEFSLQRGPLGLGEGVENEVSDGGGVEAFLVEGDE